MTRPSEQLRKSCESCRLPKTETGINRMGYCCACVMVVAWALVLVAIAVPIVLNKSLDDGLKKQGIMDSTSSPQWESWSGTGPKGPAGMTMRLFVYDYLNPLEILAGAEPIIEERGPFVYKQYSKVISAVWTPDATELTYLRYQYYVFQPELSVSDPQHTNITSINMPFVAVRALMMSPDLPFAKQNPDTLATAYPETIPEVERFFTSRSIHELLWGYEDSALKLMHFYIPAIPARYPGVFTNHTSEANAWSVGKRDALYTGVGDLTRIRDMIMYQNATNLTACNHQPCPQTGRILDVWATAAASKVSGHDGGAWAPGIRVSDTLTMWIGSFYRPVDFVYVGTTELKGVSVFQYGIAPYELEVGGRNSVYHQNKYRGLFNLTTVLSSVPTYASKARFLDCDPAITARANYIFTDSEPKDTSLFIEPRSGFALGGLARAQVSVETGPLPGMRWQKGGVPNVHNRTWFEHVIPQISPIFWAEVDAQIDDSGAEQWVDQVYGVISLIKFARYFGAIGGSLLLAISVVGLTWVRYHRKGAGLQLTTDTGANYTFDQSLGTGNGNGNGNGNGSGNGHGGGDGFGGANGNGNGHGAMADSNDLGSASVADPSDRSDPVPVPAPNHSESASLLSAAAPMASSPPPAGVADVSMSYHD